MTRTFVAVTAVVCAGMAFHMIWPTESEVLEHFGGFLAGVAALFVALFAAFKGAQEWDDWKRRKADDNRDREAVTMAEVAGRGIVAALRFGSALSHSGLTLEVEEKVHLAGHPDAAKAKAAEYVRSAAANLAATVEAYRTAHQEAEAFLPDDAVEALRDLWKAFQDANARLFNDANPYVSIDETTRRAVSALRKYTLGGHLSDGTALKKQLPDNRSGS